MSNFKDKAQTFLLGLLAGLVIAGGFFILKLDDYFRELNFYKNVVKTFTFKSENKAEEPATKAEEPTEIKEKKIKESSSKNTNTAPIDSNEVAKTPKTDFVMDADTMTRYVAKDSLKTTSDGQEDIVIRKDELLSTKTIEVALLSGAATGNTSKDSLLQKVSGVKDDKTTPQMINVELWQSPLNYKGYKMSRYKMVLYGIPSVDALKVYSVNDNIYIKYGTTVCRLENSNEFKPYERITDEAIVSKLK